MDIISTLAHEMVHLWQHTKGDQGKNGYHNKKWARKMKDIGLIPTSTGELGGKETGYKVTHLIAEGGPFERAAAALLKDGAVYWASDEGSAEIKKKRAKAAASKTKFSCPDCNQHAWAKPTAKLACGSCMVDMVAEKNPEDDETGADENN